MNTPPIPPTPPPDDPFTQFDPDEYLKKRLPDRSPLTPRTPTAETVNDSRRTQTNTAVDDALHEASPLIRYGLIAAGCVAALILTALVLIILVLAVSLLRR